MIERNKKTAVNKQGRSRIALGDNTNRNLRWLGYFLLPLLLLSVNSENALAQITSGHLYKLRNQCSNKVLEVYGVSASAGANIGQYTDFNGLNQRFKAVSVGDGYFKFVAEHSGQNMDVAGGGTGNGTNVHQWRNNNNNAQYWKLYDAGNGYYSLEPKNASGKRLDVSNGSTADGANVQIWTSNGSCAQKWKFERVTPLTGSAQAESAQIVNATVRDAANASGGKAVGHIDYSDSSVTFSVNAPYAATYAVVVSYSNGTGGTSSHNLSVNGGSSFAVSYSATSNWETFRKVSVNVNLKAGSNTLKFTKGNQYAELDRVQLMYGSRNARFWPFSSNSIWNKPIGSGASFANVDLGPIGLVVPDVEYIYFSKASDPRRPVHLVAGFGPPRVPNYDTPSYVSVYIPDNYVVADATSDPYSTPNNAAAFIDPDGKTIYELEPLTRPVYGGKVYAYNASRDGSNTQDIYGSGSWGAHFGAGMSTLGGSIRPGEISNSEPIRHAIKLEFDAHVLWRDSANPANSYRWPAWNADGDTSGYGVYNTSNSALRMGSLLAIPGNVSESSLGLKTSQAKKIFYALQNYGAYIVDTSGMGWKPNGGYAINICAERDAVDNEFGFFGAPDANLNWFNDFKALMKALKVVNNNSSGSIGGGGTLRVPAAPPLD